MSKALYEISAWQPPVEIDPSQRNDGTTESFTRTQAAEAESAGLIRRIGGMRGSVALFLGGAAALLLVALAFDAADLLGRAFGASWALGALVTALVSMTVGTALKLVWDEMVAIRRLRTIDGLRAESDRLTGSAGHGSAMAFAETLTGFYAGRDDLVQGFQTLHRSLTDAHNDAEVVALIDRQVLSGIDQRAYRCVLNAARDTAVATALSPSAALDVAIVLWRNLKLVREVSSLYGAQPAHIGSWRLMRRMLANLAVAGVAESVQHAAIDALGGSLAAAISTRLGQGMINGLLTARIGLAAMNLCRPVAFSAENKPSLRRIRTELMSVPKEVL